MGSDLYAAVDVGNTANEGWHDFIKRTSALARGPLVDRFGDCDPESEAAKLPGYLAGALVRMQRVHEECPWRNDEPYWVREARGEEFVAIVEAAEKDGEDPVGEELRALAAAVRSLLADGLRVRVWLWHSQ